MATFFRTALGAFCLAVLLYLGLHGFVVLLREDPKAHDSVTQFLMAASAELGNYYRENASSFPGSLNQLSVTENERQGSGLEHLYGGILRAPVAEVQRAFEASQRGDLLDPWGRAYLYEVSLNGEACRLISYGKDGEPGGEGTAGDLVLSKLRHTTAMSWLQHEPIWDGPGSLVQ